MPPCWPPKSKIFRNYGLPRGLHNFAFFCIDLLSIWAPSWLPTWVHLGCQDASKSEKWLQNIVMVLPKSGSGYEPAFEDRSRASWPRFLGGQGSIFDDFWMIFRTTLPRKSKNLPRTKPRIQEPAEDKAEKKIRTNASKKTQISKLCSSKLLSSSQTSLLQKRWAAVFPPGGLQSAAQLGTAR